MWFVVEEYGDDEGVDDWTGIIGMFYPLLMDINWKGNNMILIFGRCVCQKS